MISLHKTKIFSLQKVPKNTVLSIIATELEVEQFQCSLKYTDINIVQNFRDLTKKKQNFQY